MDTMKQIKELTSKYKYVLLVILAGLGLMFLPAGERADPVSVPSEPAREVTIQESLEAILSKIQGVGKVQVLLTEAAGTRTEYVYDKSTSEGNQKTDAVILTDASRAQKGLVSQVIPPVYLGAVVVCQGGDSPPVKLAVVEAVRAATGLSADKVTVLKMK